MSKIVREIEAIQAESLGAMDEPQPVKQAFADLIRRDEREKCAVLCEKQNAHATIWDCAAAIRERETT